VSDCCWPIEKALRDLVEKLDLIENDPQYLAVWESAFIHGAPYTGPSYVEELEAAKKVLEDLNA
jgi:hypothetical protein